MLTKTKIILKRILLFGIIASIVQTILFYALLELTNFLSCYFDYICYPHVFSAFTIGVAPLYFCFFVFFHNLIVAIVNKKWFSWTFFILLSIFYIQWNIPSLSYLMQWKISTTIELLIATTIFIIKLYFDLKINCQNSDRKEQEVTILKSE